jgi:hypothetical protein
VPRRQAFADWYAGHMPAIVVDPVPPLPGGDPFLRHWRQMHLPFADVGKPTAPGVVRSIRKFSGPVVVKRGKPGRTRVRPFFSPGRAWIGGIECLLGDSAIPADRAHDAASILQHLFYLPATAVFDQRPGTDLVTRLIVWLWPADSGPWFWPGYAVPKRERPTRGRKVEPVLAV